MKIALVAQYSTPVPAADATTAGDDARLVEMSRSLAGEGHQVTVYARRNGKTLPERAELAPGVSVEYVGPADSSADDSHLVRQVGAFSRRCASSGARTGLMLCTRCAGRAAWPPWRPPATSGCRWCRRSTSSASPSAATG